MAQKRALITGIKGQDGSYLSELLINKGYDVHGIIRRSESENIATSCPNIAHLIGNITLHVGSLDNYSSILNIIDKIRPDECYHFAAQSFVHSSHEEVASTLHANIEPTYLLIQALQEKAPTCKFYFSGSSEMFGNAEHSPQNEKTAFKPRSPYGISKLAGYHFMRMSRDKGFKGYGGILFNHESPRRGSVFVTRKITSAAARIAAGSKERLKLGDLDARRDWGYSPDYVEAMWLMLQGEPDDYVIGTGETHSVKEFVEKAFNIAGLDWKDHVDIDSSLIRHDESIVLCADATKAKNILSWQPKTRFDDLVRIMVEADIKQIKNS